MRIHTVRHQVWLTEKQSEKLKQNAKRTSLSQEAYIRMLIDGYCPKATPPLDYYALEHELHDISEKLGIITSKAYVNDDEMYEECICTLDWLRTTISCIQDAVLMPDKIVDPWL
ncbi:plasmid mobilization relaxosome protein MobC [Eubacteriales bacterium OttesenSCG-928-N14]|nr:plasmid mobilization relaxosome protein MobC [Eubacteriales bacterium OttesenSCG-928-N14]